MNTVHVIVAMGLGLLCCGGPTCNGVLASSALDGGSGTLVVDAATVRLPTGFDWRWITSDVTDGGGYAFVFGSDGEVDCDSLPGANGGGAQASVVDAQCSVFVDEGEGFVAPLQQGTVTLVSGPDAAGNGDLTLQLDLPQMTVQAVNQRTATSHAVTIESAGLRGTARFAPGSCPNSGGCNAYLPGTG